jgi:flagellar basal body P-ring formation protein FlgA
MTRALLFALLYAAAPASGSACQPVGGGRILVSDLAAAVPAFAAAPGDAAIGYAPLPGVPRTLPVTELARLARQYGVSAAGFTPVCFVRRTAPLAAEKIVAAMRVSLANPAANIEVLETGRYPVPEGELVFPREGLSIRSGGGPAVWNGHIEFDGGRFPVWARVRVTVHQRRVVAVTSLPGGRAIEASEIRLEEVDVPPSRTIPADTLAAVVGRVPHRTIPAGAAIPADVLAAPFAVDKGDAVRVEVRGPGTVLKLEGRAEAAGRRGDMVLVRNMESGKMFRARIDDAGSVVVEVR